jgi:hypothetical protein
MIKPGNGSSVSGDVVRITVPTGTTVPSSDYRSAVVPDLSSGSRSIVWALAADGIETGIAAVMIEKAVQARSVI